MRFCTCQSCSLQTAIDPITGKIYRGQYVGQSVYKEHQRSQNARTLGASHLGILQVNPPFFPQGPAGDTLNTDTTDTPLSKVLSKTSLSSESGSPLLSDCTPLTTEDRTFLLRLTSIEERLLHSNLHVLMSSAKVVFRYPPSRKSPPMTTPESEMLALDETIPINSDIIKEERWLHSALELTEIIQLRSGDFEVRESAKATRAKVAQEQEKLKKMKMKKWEVLRKTLGTMAVRVRLVDTGAI